MRSNWKSKYKSKKKKGKRARQRKEKRYPEGRRVGCRWSLAISHNRENICAPPRIAFAFCAWTHCPCRAARGTRHRRRCPLPQGVDMARVRVVVGGANVRRRQQRQAPRTGAGAGRRTLFSEYLGACAMVVGRVSYCLSMLLYAATNFCPTIDYCRNFFAFLRFDEQTKLLVEIDGVSARTSSTLTIANASTSSSSFGCCFCCALVPSSWACHWQSIQQVRMHRGRKLCTDFCECTGAKKNVALT